MNIQRSSFPRPLNRYNREEAWVCRLILPRHLAWLAPMGPRALHQGMGPGYSASDVCRVSAGVVCVWWHSTTGSKGCHAQAGPNSCVPGCATHHFVDLCAQRRLENVVLMLFVAAGLQHLLLGRTRAELSRTDLPRFRVLLGGRLRSHELLPCARQQSVISRRVSCCRCCCRTAQGLCARQCWQSSADGSRMGR